MVSRYVTNGPVKQEGLCIMPPPPTHYRMMPPQRADATFHVTPQQQPYAPPPPNQTGNQGPALRGMAPTGPPNQASTPPNSELKVPQMSQSVNLAFVSPQVRGGTQGFFGRPPPQNQPPRMPNHRIQGQQPVFPPQSAPFMQPVAQVQPIYCMSYYGTSTGQRPAILPQYFPGQTFTAISYPQTPQQTQTYLNYPQYLPRGAQPQVVASAPQNLQQVPPPALPLAPASQPQLGQQKKRRAKAIPIIDPESGKDKLDEIYVCDESHPASGESSARQTPQPPYIPNKEIQNTFNKQVNMVMNQDKMDELEQSSSPSLDQHLDTQQMYQTLPSAPQAVHISNRIELVQSSKLQLPMKEFIPAATHSNAAKEMTPVVSANVVTAEVTINKQNRESPAKNRKPRDPPGAKELKEPPTIVEKRDDYKIIVQDEPKVKETTLPPVPPTTVSSKETKEANNQREEKKNQKKDKVEQKLSVSPSSEIILENISQQNSLPPPAQENGKPRNKDAPKPTQPTSPMVASNHKQNTPIPVPQTQPAKPNNKTNKNRELNMKGANKEGTDMDAFSDNTQKIDTVVVTNTNVTTNDALNANDIINVNDSNKRIESNEVSTIKSESKSLPKKIDVTDIVKEVPKPFVAPVEACDETDRIEYDNDKIVQAKNEANSKVTVENDSNIIELRASLPYKDDQWSPSNTAGKKIYDKDFLLALRNDPKSRQKPDNLLDVIAQEDRGKVGDISRYPLGGKTTDFAPTFSGSNYAGKSNSTQRSTLPKQRNSQQGKSGGSAKGNKGSNVIRSISVRGDVKLNESENAWKPARFISSANMSDDEKKTQELYKRVRGVLNKLTPQKFETLLHQVRSLTIDTKERLQGVIDLVFEKAVDEPNFSVAYALMCKELALMEVPANVPRKDGDSVNFRKLLVTRCQLEFEKNSVDETARNAKVKEIEECTDPEKKKELQLVLEDDDRRIRRKSVGNIRFIGELFKQNMLTVNIMMRCLHHLLENKEEESLECLCKLLATVGKEVEKKMDLNTIFIVIREIVDRKHGKISSRVRFMLQDVIDLRNSKWIPRRQDINPRTIDEIQKEASDEQLTIQALNAVPITPRKDDRSVPGSGSGKRGTRNTSDQEGWSTASSRGRTPFSVQSDKLKNKPPQIDEPLGSSQMFGTWVRGSNIKTNTPTPSMGNMFAALENIGNDVDKRSPMNYSSKDPYHSKGTSLERNFKHSFEDGRGSRSGSQHRPHDSQRSKPMPTNQQNIPKNNPPATTKPRQPPVEQMSPECVEQIERKIKNILEEYLNDCYSVDECDDDIRTSLPPTTLTKLVSESYICVLDRSKTARLGTGSLFANLLKRSTLSVDNYCFGLEEVLSQADDLTIDIPKIWDYLAEIIAPIINENAVPLKRLHKSFDILIKQGHASKLLDPLFKLVITEKGPNYLHNQWDESNLKFSDFMEPSQVNSFIQENQLEFLLGGSNTVVGQSELTYEQIHKKLLEFFANDNSLDDIFRWIEATVGERAHEKLFVRTLATAVFEDSIVKSKLKAENLRKHYSLLIRIVDGRLDYELECLYALQALINRLEHPQGILLSICGSLYDDSVFSHDGFVKWETSDNPAEQEGKGVALKQLTSFFTQLKEADEETSSIEDA